LGLEVVGCRYGCCKWYRGKDVKYRWTGGDCERRGEVRKWMDVPLQILAKSTSENNWNHINYYTCNLQRAHVTVEMVSFIVTRVIPIYGNLHNFYMECNTQNCRYPHLEVGLLISLT
jgi:hypothetical protein